MNNLIRFAFLLALYVVSNSALAATYCVQENDYAGSGSRPCFNSFAAAEQYLFSNFGKGDKNFSDADSTLFQSTGITFGSLPGGGVRKYYNYVYRPVPPKFDAGAWSTSAPGTCSPNPYFVPYGYADGCATESESLQAGLNFWRQTYPKANLFLLARGAGDESSVNVTGQYVDRQAGNWSNGRMIVYQTVGSASYWDRHPQGMWESVNNIHYWKCADTYEAKSGPFSSACRLSYVQGVIYVDNEAIKSAASCSVGNPCHPQSGIKTQDETDFEWEGIKFTRTFSSSSELPTDQSFGSAWTHSLDVSLVHQSATGAMMARFGSEIELYRRDPSTNVYHSVNSVGSSISKESNGDVLLRNANGRIFTFISAGAEDFLLQSFQDLSIAKTFVFEYCPATDDAACPSLEIKAVHSSSGRTLDFVYGDYLGPTGTPSGHRLKAMVADGQVVTTYSYDSTGRLMAAAYPDSAGSTSRTYQYNEPDRVCVDSVGTPIRPCFMGSNNALLTSITDESAQVFAIFRYDNFGRVVSSEHAGDAYKNSLRYEGELSTTVTDENGRETTYNSGAGEFLKLTSISSGGTTSTFTYDSNGHVDIATDKSGAITDYEYDANGHLLQLVRAKGSAQEQTEITSWDDLLNLPVKQELPGRRLITTTYNERSQPLSVTRMDLTAGQQRAVRTYTYCEQIDVESGRCPLVGLLLGEDGPRTDVSDITSYLYYPADDVACSTELSCSHRKGDLAAVTNALGHITKFLKYDGAGRVISTQDANGVVTDLDYNSRGWLVARKLRGGDDAVETDDEIIRVDYWPTGLVRKVTESTGSVTTYSYDAAHRLTDVSDTIGNSIHYSLNAAGDRIGEDTKDSSGVLRRALSRVYDDLGELETQSDAYAHVTHFTYDANGNTSLTIDALGRVTDNDYDPLNRLSRTLQDANGIAAETRFAYDSQDNLAQVTDPRGLVTGYVYDGLGNLTHLRSPDTGGTSYTYDSAGNRKSKSDALGITTEYTYDSLNRLTTISYSDGSSGIAYTYDASVVAGCTTPIKGRLSSVMNSSGITDYCYDRFGNVTSKKQTTNNKVLSLSYAYSIGGRLQSIRYPDGAIVDYVRNGEGQITEIGVTPADGAERRVLLTAATYAPFGPVVSWRFGNGRELKRSLNQNYQPDVVSDTSADGLSLEYSFDAVGNVESLQNGQGTEPLARYAYDSLGRLSDVLDGTTGTPIEHYQYDAAGNRRSVTNAGTTVQYAYPTDSNRLSSIGRADRIYDAVGNTIEVGNHKHQFSFDAAGRMASMHANKKLIVSYFYNGKGERVREYESKGSDTYSIYDEAGRWIGDYDGNGSTIQQAIWLDDLPVGLLVGANANQDIKYVEPDALGSPRVVIDPVRDMALWSWGLNGEAFGESPPNQDPDGDKILFVLNMRFPGQRYDAASGFLYNYMRDYDPSRGGYLESDPIGLGGGINTYAYANNTPLTAYDKTGLAAIRLPPLDPRAQVPDGTIYCNGGVITPFINIDSLPSYITKCVGDCILAHEMSHVRDAQHSNPGVCKYWGWVPGIYPKGLVSFPRPERLNSELVAYAAELRCLAAKLRAINCSDDHCKTTIKQRIFYITHSILPTVYDGTYGEGNE